MGSSHTKKQLREFGITIGVGFPLLIGLIIPTVLGHGFRAWTLWIAAPAIILAFVSPNILNLPYKIWMAIGHILGFINSHIILGIVFIVVLQPIAFIMRIVGHDPLRKKKDKAMTYRETNQKTPIDLRRIF